MSHTVHLTPEDKKASKNEADRNRPVYMLREALFAACAAMGLAEPKWVTDHRVGDGPRATGWAVDLKSTDPHVDNWTNLAVFNTETGAEYVDNWPTRGPKHVDVREGRVRCFTGGRWGDENLLWQLDAEYVKAGNQAAAETYLAQAIKLGDEVSIVSKTDDRIELLIDDGVAPGGGTPSSNPLDGSNPSLK